MDATEQRWVTSLANYNFMLHHRSGKSNVKVDALSIIPWKKSKMATLDPQSHLATQLLSVAEAYISPQAVKALLGIDALETPNNITNEQWKAAQRADEVTTQVLGYLQKKSDTVDRKSLFHEVHGMLRQKDKLVLKSDMVYRQCTSQLQDQPMYQFMLPMKYQQQALTACDDDVGHFGVWSFGELVV